MDTLLFKGNPVNFFVLDELVNNNNFQTIKNIKIEHQHRIYCIMAMMWYYIDNITSTKWFG